MKNYEGMFLLDPSLAGDVAACEGEQRERMRARLHSGGIGPRNSGDAPCVALAARSSGSRSAAQRGGAALRTGGFEGSKDASPAGVHSML